MTAESLPVKVDEGRGDPIVLLHGLGNNHRSWSYVLEHLDYSRNRVIAPDLLGFGDAPKPRIDYTPEAHADAVIAVLDELGISDAVVAGHSMGCLVAAAVADKRPDLVSRLVLLGAPTFARIPRRRRIPLAKLFRAEDRYTAIFRLIADLPELTMAAAGALETFAPLVKGMEITEETWPAFRSSLEKTIIQTGSYRTLRSLTTPALLVYGHLDVFVIKRNLKWIARRNPAATVSTMIGPHEITPVHGESISKLLQPERA